MCLRKRTPQGKRKRDPRSIGDASEGQIVSGQKGYNRTIEATVTEIAETAGLTRADEKMIQRSIAIQRAAHPTLAGAKR